jgi:hypothetical protein
MAGEALLINPRRKRRRARRKKARRPRRARATLVARINRRRRPRRHRRINARRHRRRARSNPRLPLIGNVNLNAIGAGALGYIGTRYAAGFALTLLPPEWKAAAGTVPTDQQNLTRIGVKAVVGLGLLPMAARMLRLKGAAGPIAIGAGIAVAVDLFETYLQRMLPLPLGDYEQQTLTDYESRQLTGADDNAGAFGGGAYGFGAY